MKSRTCSFKARARALASFLLLVAAAMSGCEVTPDKIEVWKESVNGPPKIRAAIRDTSQQLTVRVLAAHALAELGHFEPLQEDLKSLAQADRLQLIKKLVEQLVKRMSGTSDQATTQLQMQAKDALFSMRGSLPPALKTEVDAGVVAWVLGDWRRRRGGDHSGEKVALAVGAPAAKLLLVQLTREPALVDVFAPIIARVGDAAAHKAAAAKIVDIARKQQGRESKTLAALARFKGPTARAFLVELAQKGKAVEVRQNALFALARCADASVLPAMAALATNTAEDGGLRDAAMSVFDQVDSERSLELLGGIIAGTDKVLRYRAAEALVACCKAKGVAKLLASLPPRYSYTRQDVKDFLEKDVRELGKPALVPLRKALGSPSWIARVIAVRLLGAIGAKADLSRLEKLASDRTPIPGWKATLGTEAGLAAEQLKKRLSNSQ